MIVIIKNLCYIFQTQNIKMYIQLFELKQWNRSSFTLSLWEVCGTQHRAAYNKTDEILAL